MLEPDTMRLCNKAVAAILLTGAALSMTAQLPHGPTILVPVSVFTKNQQENLSGLNKESFHLYEGDVQQEIGSFGVNDAPASIGILVDLSGSMTTKLIRTRESVMRFIGASNPRDEYLVIGFDEHPKVIEDFTNSVGAIQTRLAGVRTGHRTALLDAIDLGLEKMKQAHYERRVLLLVSDGMDNGSHLTQEQVRIRVGSSNIEIYSIGIIDPYAATPEERTGPILLNWLCNETGGRLFRVEDISEMSDIAERISTELRNQYVIGYTPKNVPRNGKWRKVKVKLTPPSGLPPLTVHARTGYYAPLQ